MKYSFSSWWKASSFLLLLLFCHKVVCGSFVTPWTGAHQAPSVHGIFQARILEWIAISFSRGSSWPRDQTHVSYIGRQIPYHWATWKALTPFCHHPNSRSPHPSPRLYCCPSPLSNFFSSNTVSDSSALLKHVSLSHKPMWRLWATEYMTWVLDMVIFLGNYFEKESCQLFSLYVYSIRNGSTSWKCQNEFS